MATLDLGFVGGWVKDCYADRGCPAIGPVVVFEFQLDMYFERSRSEQKLTETASLHLAHRWYLSYALDKLLPDRSSLTWNTWGTPRPFSTRWVVTESLAVRG